MTKAAQNLLLITLGGAVLWVTVATDEYLNYVKSGFRPILIAAAAAVIVLGAAGLRREWRDDTDQVDTDQVDHRDDHSDPGLHADSDDHDHDHARGPRVAWLLCLPALAIFLIAPPALGSFTAARGTSRTTEQAAVPAEGFRPLKPATGGGPVDMTLGEYIGRSFEAQTGDPSSLQGRSIRLTGFVVSRKGGGWQLTRLKMSCCAGDAIPFSVIIQGVRRPPADSWVRVTGTWVPPGEEGARTGVHVLAAANVTPVRRPKHPYE